jgi:hypothetical protein
MGEVPRRMPVRRGTSERGLAMSVLYEVGRALSLAELAVGKLKDVVSLLELHGGNPECTDEVTRAFREAERDLGSSLKAWLWAAKLLKQRGK